MGVAGKEQDPGCGVGVGRAVQPCEGQVQPRGQRSVCVMGVGAGLVRLGRGVTGEYGAGVKDEGCCRTVGEAA